MRKDILGWELNGKEKTIQLDDDKYKKLMDLTKKALRSHRGLPFKDLEKMLARGGMCSC